MTYDWWLTPAAYAAIGVILTEARLRRAASKGKKLVFHGSLLFKLGCGGGALGLFVLLYQQWVPTELWVKLGCVGFVLAFLFGWPKTITTDDHGIESHWWWRRKVFIPWDEVEYAETGPLGAIKVVGTHGRIEFEGYNADPDRFRKEVTKRSSVKKIVAPSEFTGLHLQQGRKK
jgi:hypothetical protein